MYYYCVRSPAAAHLHAVCKPLRRNKPSASVGVNQLTVSSAAHKMIPLEQARFKRNLSLPRRFDSHRSSNKCGYG